MKLLFDQNLSFKLCALVSDIFPDSIHVRLVGLAEADDRAIWDYARANRFTIVSQDADFAEMAAVLGQPPKVIWLRTGNQTSAAVEGLLRRHAALIQAFDFQEASCLEIYERYGSLS